MTDVRIPLHAWCFVPPVLGVYPRGTSPLALGFCDSGAKSFRFARCILQKTMFILGQIVNQSLWRALLCLADPGRVTVSLQANLRRASCANNRGITPKDVIPKE